ncbi:hypothetical protein [Arthrobacter sp. 92]|uniref:hypothetical protein n=1 Tax=Arthrobacter sp. 92 TaxID=3418175 RepID=UPI003D05C95C
MSDNLEVLSLGVFGEMSVIAYFWVSRNLFSKSLYRTVPRIEFRESDLIRANTGMQVANAEERLRDKQPKITKNLGNPPRLNASPQIAGMRYS